jgi:hypothetical protein
MDIQFDSGAKKALAEMAVFSRLNNVECDTLLIGKFEGNRYHVFNGLFLPSYFGEYHIVSIPNKIFIEREELEKIDEYVKNKYDGKCMGDNSIFMQLRKSYHRYLSGIKVYKSTADRPKFVYCPHLIRTSFLMQEKIKNMANAIGYAHIHPWMHRGEIWDRISFKVRSAEFNELNDYDKKQITEYKSQRQKYLMVIVPPDYLQEDSIARLLIQEIV